MTFTGIPAAALDFYEDLENDNSKAFWTAHKHIYEESIKAPLEALAEELGKQYGAAKLFRPYRDVRFAKDKSPYKTNQGLWFGETSLYLDISAAGLFVGGGYWETSTPQVDRMRRAVADDVAGPQLARTLAAVRRKGLTVGGEQLSRVPNGYDRDHVRADLLKYKTLTASAQLGAPAWLGTPRAKAEIVKAWKGIVPLVSWLDTHVGRD